MRAFANFHASPPPTFISAPSVEKLFRPAADCHYHFVWTGQVSCHKHALDFLIFLRSLFYFQVELIGQEEQHSIPSIAIASMISQHTDD
jgi:hypothetical protein